MGSVEKVMNSRLPSVPGSILADPY